MKHSFLIEQPLLKEACPCGSKKKFGSCCGGQMQCDCKSHFLAVECCYKEETEELSEKKQPKKSSG